MNRSFFARLTTALIMAVTVPLAAMGEYITYTASYDLTPQVRTDTLGGVTYSTVHYGDLINSGEPGAPSLPVDYIRFSVPYNATNFSVTTTLGNVITYYLNHMVYPCQPSRMMNDTTPVIITLPDSAIYNSGQYYPAQKAWVINEGFLAGENHIVTVAVMPFAYQHTSTQEKLRKYKKITVKLNYDLSDTNIMSPIVRQDTTLRKEGYILTQNMVVNPNDVITNSPFISTLTGIDEECSYLIVTTPELQHSMRRLAAINRQKGYSINCVSINEVISDSLASGGDSMDPEHIYNSDNASVLREYLRNHYTYNGLKYVLLAGDIPYRIYITKSGRNILTDWYYSDLNSKWNDYEHDKEAELFVGRITAKTNEQIENYTNKLLLYELNPGNGDYSYLKKAFYSNGRDFTGFLNGAINNLMSVFPDTIVINDYKGNNTRHPKGHEIIDTIRTNRVGFICIFNHGDTTRTKVYGVDSLEYNYFIKATSTVSSDNGLNCLNNKYYPIIYYSPSCATVPFDNQYTLNFGESFTTGKDYGGPIYIGHTRSVRAIESKIMTNKFAQQLVQGHYQLGAAYAFSTSLSSPTCKEDIYTHCYLGDPTLEIWTDTPQVYTNIGISRTNNSITINGIDADSTIVAFYSNDGNIGTDTISSTSITINSISPNSSVMLYKHNHIPYITPLELQNITLSNSQYVIASDLTAGSSIDNNRTSGDVIVPNGVEYEIEASGKVTLEDGFKVEKGATFAVYPACF